MTDISDGVGAVAGSKTRDGIQLDADDAKDSRKVVKLDS